MVSDEKLPVWCLLVVLRLMFVSFSLSSSFVDKLAFLASF